MKRIDDREPGIGDGRVDASGPEATLVVSTGYAVARSTDDDGIPVEVTELLSGTAAPPTRSEPPTMIMRDAGQPEGAAGASPPNFAPYATPPAPYPTYAMQQPQHASRSPAPHATVRARHPNMVPPHPDPGAPHATASGASDRFGLPAVPKLAPHATAQVPLSGWVAPYVIGCILLILVGAFLLWNQARVLGHF